MALKTNLFKNRYQKAVLSFGLALLLTSGFFGAKTAKATDIPVNNVTVSTDIEVGGKKDNLVRMLKTGTASFTVDLTITKATTAGGTSVPQIVLSNDVDNFDFDTTFGKRPISGFGAGLEIYGNGNTCVTNKIVGLIPFFTNNKGYLSCSFPGGTNKNPSPAYQNNAAVIGQTYKYTFNLNASTLSALNINPNSTGATQSFAVYPYFDIYVIDSGTVDIAYTSASKQVYVQFFNDQATLTQAITNGARPSDVPGYGTNTGAANSTSDAGSTLLGLINKVIGFILGFIQEVVYFIFYFLVAPLIQSMLSIHTYTDAFAAVIYPGWEIIRNISNILFIVALIAIGLATLFRVESYQFRHLLVQLIIAALLVNFSLVIAQAVLGLADTVQSQFLPDNLGVIRSLAKDLIVPWRSEIWNMNISSGGYFATTVQQLFWLALSLGSFAVFCAIAVYLVIRVVALWVLLMISPIAYVAGVLPATHHFRTEWWNYFLKYAFFTPIMAFFLNMAALMVYTYKQNPVIQQLMSNPQELGLGDFSGFVLSVTSNILLLVFLLVGLKVADEFGIIGAHSITSMAQKGIYAPFAGAGWLGKRGVGRLGRWWNEWTTERYLEGHEGKKPTAMDKAKFALLNPKAFVKGWEARAHELQHEAQEVAEAGGREVAEQFLTGGKLRIPYRQFVERKHENDFLKDYENMRKETLMRAAKDAEGMKGVEGEVRRRAIVKAAARNGYMDDLLRMKHFATQYADKDGTFYSAEVLNRFLYGYLGHGEQAMRFMAEDMEQLGKDTGHYEYLGHAYFDPNDRTFKRGMEVVGEEMTGRANVNGRGNKVESLKNTWQAGFAIGELKKVGGRQRAGIAPHNLMSLRAKLKENGELDVEGEEIKDAYYGREDGHLDEYQRGAIGIYDAATLRDAHFAQSRMKEWLLSREVDQTTGAIIIKSLEDYQRIKAIYRENPNFVRQMYAQSTGFDAKDVTGIRIVAYEADGTKTAKPSWIGQTGDEDLHMGEPATMDMPISNAIKPELMKNKTLMEGLSDNIKKELEAKLPSIVADAYCGGLGSEDAIKVRVAAVTQDEGKAVKIASEIKKRIIAHIEENYNPIPVISRIDTQVQGRKTAEGKEISGFSPAQISDLNHAMLEAAKTAYKTNSKLDVAGLRRQIEEQINKLKREKKSPQFDAITSEDINIMARHAVPVG